MGLKQAKPRFTFALGPVSPRPMSPREEAKQVMGRTPRSLALPALPQGYASGQLRSYSVMDGLHPELQKHSPLGQSSRIEFAATEFPVRQHRKSKEAESIAGYDTWKRDIRGPGPLMRHLSTKPPGSCFKVRASSRRGGEQACAPAAPLRRLNV